MVYMKHDGIGSLSTAVSVEVFDLVWAPRDWVLLGEGESFATDALNRDVLDVADLKREELLELNAIRGISTVGKVEVLRKTFVESFGVEAVEAAPASTDTNSADAPATQNKER
jgi:hypothetical protein